MFKCRTRTLDIKTHLTYKYRADSVCRGCGQTDETYEHIINCGKESIEVLDLNTLSEMDRSVKISAQICTGRIREFMNKHT